MLLRCWRRSANLSSHSDSSTPSPPPASLSSELRERDTRGSVLADGTVDSLLMCISGDGNPLSSSSVAIGSSSSTCSFSFPLSTHALEWLVERRKLLAMLTELSLRITDDADERIRCSPRARMVIPGKGSLSLVQTSDNRASSRARSPREGASTGIRLLEPGSDLERFICEGDNGSLETLVFLMMTWYSGDLSRIVSVRRTDNLPKVPRGMCWLTQYIYIGKRRHTWS